MSESVQPGQILSACYQAALRAVDPVPLLRELLRQSPTPSADVAVIAVGKAAVSMARGVQQGLAELNRKLVKGLVIDPGPTGEWPTGWLEVMGDHPVPGAQSALAAEALRRWISGLPEDLTVEVLISGGASALIGAPAAGVDATWYSRVTATLFDSGLPIDRINAVRRRISLWGGGRMAAALAPRQINLRLLSDVPGDQPADIGSGPCSPDPTTAEDLLPLLQSIDCPLPGGTGTLRLLSGLQAISNPAAVFTTTVAGNRTALEGAIAEASRRRIPHRELRTSLQGEASVAGRAVALEAMRLADQWHADQEALRDEGLSHLIRPLLLIAGGETTVTMSESSGIGGRSQELALAAAEMLDISRHNITLLAAGTDGVDGRSDAAGAMVDRSTWAAISESGLDPAQSLLQHDSSVALDSAGALLRTGPTGTNVMDLVLGLVGAWPGRNAAPEPGEQRWP